MLAGFPLSAPANQGVPGPAVGSWSMAAQVSTNGALIDYSGNGHHGWYGGVKKALLADTTYGDRGLILPGISGNYASVPDNAGNRPTGDQWYYADFTADTTPSADGWIHGRYDTGGTGRCAALTSLSTGHLRLIWSTDGAATVQVGSTVTLASVGITDTTRAQVYVTLDVDNGAGGYEVKFYWRVPGGSWAQLGSTVTGGTTTSVFAGTAVWGASGNSLGTLSMWAGTLYAARMGTGIVIDTGTTLSVDFTTQAQGTRSFTCTTGQVVTVNQAGTSTAEPTNLWYTGTAYAYFPGTASNSVTVAGMANNTIYDYTVTYLDATTATGTATSDGSGNLVIGATAAGFSNKNVKFIDITADGGGATVVYVDFTRIDLYNSLRTTTTSTTGSKTVTINRSPTGLKTAIVTENVALFDGVDDYISIDDHARLDFAETESLTAAWAGRVYGTTADVVYIAKKADLTTTAGWSLDRGTANAPEFTLGDGTATCTDVSGALTQGQRTVVVGVRRVANDNIEAYTAGVGSGSPTTDNTTATLANSGELRIGRLAGAGTAYNLMEFVGAALYRRALSPAQILRLNTEL